MSSVEFIQRMSELSAKGENFATATVVQTKGSTTGRIGFKILISQDGSILHGNLGGGCSESVVVEQALDAMKDGKSRTMSVLLEEEEKGGIGANCGGSMEIYIEPFVPKNQLIVFGGGGERSIAGPLVKLAKLLNYNVVVVDPGAAQEMYPDADRVIPEFPDEAVRKINFGKNSSIVIVTKHKYDEPSLKSVVGLDVPYIGLVSSYHRASALFKQMMESEGAREEDLKKIRVPIGLDIGAQSYEEIALSIMAEIIKANKGGSGRSISDYKGVFSRPQKAEQQVIERAAGS
ncbi:MAG TPA: XdhC family protein [Nitrososphaerales archaeon]|nr:XdhC family protein [Nitrososphaerales archaeon]